MAIFTKEDYREYFNSIAEKEKEMSFALEKLMEKIKDKKKLIILKSIAEDEARHYAEVKNCFDRVLQKVEVERRGSKRDYKLGYVQIKVLKTNEEFQAKCIDICLTGLKIETEHKLETGNELELEVTFLNTTETYHYHGSLVWINQVKPDLYAGGIEYSSL